MIDPWHSLTPAVRQDLPVQVRDWIALETSMTARIGQVVDRPIDVEVLRQVQAGLYPDEAQYFAESSDQLSDQPSDQPPEQASAPPVVREVCLSAEGQPYLIARTALTSHKLQTHPTIVELGNKALGTLLFAGPKPCPYTARDYAELRQGHPLFDLVRLRDTSDQEAYWARRTLFWLFDEPLLVTEIFLPALISHPSVR